MNIEDRHLAILAVLDGRAIGCSFPAILKELGYPKGLTAFTMRPLLQEGYVSAQTLKRVIRYSITPAGTKYLEDSSYLINGKTT